jgi:hypothetical protein
LLRRGSLLPCAAAVVSHSAIAAAIATAIGSGGAPAITAVSTATAILARRGVARPGLRAAALRSAALRSATLRSTAAALRLTTAATMPLAAAVVAGRALTLARFRRVSECGRNHDRHSD